MKDATLGDYQNIALRIADWSSIRRYDGEITQGCPLSRRRCDRPWRRTGRKTMREEVQQDAGSDRARPAGGCHEVQRQGRRAPVSQDGDETPGLDGLPGDEIRLQRYPLAGVERGA